MNIFNRKPYPSKPETTGADTLENFKTNWKREECAFYEAIADQRSSDQSNYVVEQTIKFCAVWAVMLDDLKTQSRKCGPSVPAPIALPVDEIEKLLRTGADPNVLTFTGLMELLMMAPILRGLAVVNGLADTFRILTACVSAGWKVNPDVLDNLMLITDRRIMRRMSGAEVIANSDDIAKSIRKEFSGSTSLLLIR